MKRTLACLALSLAALGAAHAAADVAPDALVRKSIDEVLAIIKADPASYQQLGRAKAEGMGCTSPALSNGRVIVRQKEKLVCFDLRPVK